jgi:hypothetical protein
MNTDYLFKISFVKIVNDLEIITIYLLKTN